MRTIQLHNDIIRLRKKGLSHQMVIQELGLTEVNYFKHYGKITTAFEAEIKAKNSNDIAEAIKLAEIRLLEIYDKAVDGPLNSEDASYFMKIKAGELGMTVIQNLLKIQYDGNKLFKVLTKGVNDPQIPGQDPKPLAN